MRRMADPVIVCPLPTGIFTKNGSPAAGGAVTTPGAKVAWMMLIVGELSTVYGIFDQSIGRRSTGLAAKTKEID